MIPDKVLGHIAEKPVRHILTMIGVKNTISDNFLGEHIEFYSDTEAFSTHSNCDLCGKYTFWNSTATQRRETVSTHYNCDWCGKLHDS